MTNKTLNQILDNVNNSIYKNTQYAIHSINNNVDLININATSCIELNTNTFYDFYLIKGDNTKDKYVGIIFDMVSDLHILIDEKYRGQKYLQKTLVPTILPFIAYYKERNLQKLSFENSSIKEYFIKKFGFINSDDDSNNVYMSLEDMVHKKENEISIPIRQENEEELINELDSAILTLRMIERKIELQKNNNLFNETYYLSDAYNNLKDAIRY